MTIRDRYLHGTFCWAELGTDDPGEAKRFYEALLGWTYEDVPVGPGLTLTMCKVQRKNVALLRRRPDELRGKPVSWLSYLSVDDVDATLAKVTANGGTLSRPPMELPKAGRMAVVLDPNGGRFGLWQPKGVIGAEIVEVPGTLRFNELYSHPEKMDAAEKFYTATFGWVHERVELGPKGTFTLFSRPEAVEHTGGIASDPSGAPAHWIPYFLVENTDASHAKLLELGGKSLVGPADIDFGRFAVVTDPQGAKFALFQNAF